MTDQYSDLVTKNLVPSNTVWERPKSRTQYIKHPDLGNDIKIVFDANGLKNSGEAKNNYLVGFFGDSFTENRRVEEDFTFSKILNNISTKENFANFGVDGFGLEQSVQRWINFSESIDLKHVVYVFCSNDLRNTYEIQLFSESSLNKNIFENQIYEDSKKISNKIVRSLGRLRITYLTRTAYYKVVGKVEEINEFGDRFPIKFEFLSNSQPKEFRDEYAGMLITDFLSTDPSDETLFYVNKFKKIINLWKNSLHERGIEFHVAILPRDLERKMSEKLFDRNINLIYLKKTEEYSLTKDFSTTFKNDGHWNELGNLAASVTLRSYFKDLKIWEEDTNESYEKDLFTEIIKYYSDRNSVPALNKEASQ